MIPCSSFAAVILFPGCALESPEELSKNTDARCHATLIKLESQGVEPGPWCTYVFKLSQVILMCDQC